MNCSVTHDLNRHLVQIDRADEKHEAAMDEVQAGDFVDAMVKLDFNAEGLALEMIEDLFAAIKTGNPLQAQLAFAKLTTDMNALIVDAAKAGQ